MKLFNKELTEKEEKYSNNLADALMLVGGVILIIFGAEFTWKSASLFFGTWLLVSWYKTRRK